MLNSVFPSKIARNPTETNDKLLELSDQDASSSPSANQTDEPDIPTTSEMASVITQVSRLDIDKQNANHYDSDDQDAKSNWKSKFR